MEWYIFIFWAETNENFNIKCLAAHTYRIFWQSLPVERPCTLVGKKKPKTKQTKTKTKTKTKKKKKNDTNKNNISSMCNLPKVFLSISEIGEKRCTCLLDRFFF